MLYLVRSRSSPHTRDVLWKCCRSVISMIGYDAAAGHVVLIECHHSLLSMIWADLLLQWRSCEFFFGQNKHFVYLQVPGIEIVMDRLLQNPTDEYTHAPRSAGNTFIHACVFFFLSHLRVFSPHYFVKLPPLRNSYPGSHGPHSSLFPSTARAFV